MALVRKFGEIPTDAQIITETEALKYQWKIIHNWEPQSEVWPFKYGVGVLGVFSGISSIFINNHFRSRLRLGTYGQISTYLPSVVMPTIFSAFIHQQFVSNKVVLQNDCPICIELRAVCFQVLLSTVYPLILAPVASLNFAVRYNTYKVPPITEQPKEVFALLKRLTKPIKNILIAGTIIQSLVAVAVTHFESKSVFKIQNKLLEVEREIEQGQNL